VREAFPIPEPLTDLELDRLRDFMRRCKGGKAMNLEELDGFLAALIAGPEMVRPSEYYSQVFGGPMDETCEFDSLDQANDILGLISRNWNIIAGTLYADEPYLPMMFENDEGVATGNDWARGFMRGVEMRREAWVDLIASDEYGGSILPMLMLYHEHDPDPEMRPNPIGPEQREDIIIHMAAGLLQIYRHYFSQRQSSIPRRSLERTVRRETAKIGRNDPCPCGSGKKYKHCHGDGALH